MGLLMTRYVAFVHVASEPDGSPVYSITDIIEPLPKYRATLLRSARLTAGERGYVEVGPAGIEWDAWKTTARRINGLAGG
jgi:hypothetical protein